MQLAEFRKPTDSDDEECSEAEAPLSQRALALQERVFSSRILWYDGNQLRWYCRQSQYSEELPLLPPEGEGQQRSKTYLPNCPFTPSNLTNGDKTVVLFWWDDILEKYMRRRITYQSDRLPGIAGLAKHMAKQTGLTYVCGMWKEDFLSGLLWVRLRLGSTTNAGGPPSWSWAKCGGEGNESTIEILSRFEYPLDLGEEFDACGTEVVDLVVVNEDGGISGQVISASLTLKARWRYLNLGTDAGLPKLTAFHGLGLTLHDIKSDQEEPRIPRPIVCALDRFLEPDVWTQQILSSHVIYVQIGRWLDEQPTSGVLCGLFLWSLLIGKLTLIGELKWLLYRTIWGILLYGFLGLSLSFKADTAPTLPNS